jgi:glycosyltransferase involved in cell wall biosynthesis
VIYFDVTKAGAAGHRSGLMRVSSRVREALGPAAREVAWQRGALAPVGATGSLALANDDWFLTSELFSPEERPGFVEFVAQRACRFAAIFHDAIPLKHPHITWPQSVGRHPGYMKLLAGFDRVFAVSRASRDELVGFWEWQRLDRTPPVEVLALGADFNGEPRNTSAPPSPPSTATPHLLCLGILEPRKNQSFLLDVCDGLWREGLRFDLHLVGRVNPHFGAPIAAKIKALRRAHAARLHFHEAASDTTVAALYRTARATVFPTLAEGCGLPLLESLWMGVPCVHSDLPVLHENAAAGGCLAAPVQDAAAWTSALRRVLSDDTLHAQLTLAARTRPLPMWSATASALRTALGSC